jgi:hypothetical protein
MKFLYNLLLTFNSTSWVIVLYGVKQEWSLWNVPNWLSSLILLTIPIITSILSLVLTNFLGNDNLNSCIEVEYANSSFIPTYLGYFFVGLSLESTTQLAVVYVLIFLFTQLSQTEYFNPIYLFFGYKFYHVRSSEGTKLFIITKRKIRNAKNEKFIKLKRINESTFIEMRRTKDESIISKD